MPELQQLDLRDTAISESTAQQLADAGIEVLMSAESPQTEAELHEEVRQFFYRKGYSPAEREAE